MLSADVPERDYHAETFWSGPPLLSASAAWTLLTQSPEHAALAHPKLGGAGSESSRAQDEGSVLHALLLGSGPAVHVVRADSFRTKAAREERDAAQAAGDIPLLEGDHERLLKAAEKIRSRLRDAGLVLDGASEVTAVWGAGPVMARGRMDHVLSTSAAGMDLEADEARVVIVDLKTTAQPVSGRAKLGADLVRRGAHVQAFAYMQAIQTLRPRWKIDDFVWVVAEREPPYGLMVARPGEDMQQLGLEAWERAVGAWDRGLRLGFEGATVGALIDPVTLHAPAWAFHEAAE